MDILGNVRRALRLSCCNKMQTPHAQQHMSRMMPCSQRKLDVKQHPKNTVNRGRKQITEDKESAVASIDGGSEVP